MVGGWGSRCYCKDNSRQRMIFLYTSDIVNSVQGDVSFDRTLMV